MNPKFDPRASVQDALKKTLEGDLAQAAANHTFVGAGEFSKSSAGGHSKSGNNFSKASAAAGETQANEKAYQEFAQRLSQAK